MTCSTFSLYAASFTKEAKQALACAESPEGDQSRAKRWDTLGKFETHFNHWYVTRLQLSTAYLPQVAQVQGMPPATVRVCASR